MFKNWNRYLAFLLSIALVFTTFGSDFASVRAFATEGEALESTADEGEGDAQISDVPGAEEIPQDEQITESDGDLGTRQTLPRRSMTELLLQPVQLFRQLRR